MFSTPETSVTYLYVSNYTSLERTRDLAREYAAHFHNQSSVQTYVAGVVPAQVAQADYLESRLHLFEVATLVLIAVVVGLTFRSVVAPFVVLLAAGLGYLVAIRSLGVLAAALGFALPDQLQPLIAALLIGVVTDYCVLFFAGLRQQLDRGLPRLEAAHELPAQALHVPAGGGDAHPAHGLGDELRLEPEGLHAQLARLEEGLGHAHQQAVARAHLLVERLVQLVAGPLAREEGRAHGHAPRLLQHVHAGDGVQLQVAPVDRSSVPPVRRG